MVLGSNSIFQPLGALLESEIFVGLGRLPFLGGSIAWPGAERLLLMVARATEYAAKHCWDNCKGEYLNLVDSLCDSSVEMRVSSSLQTAA